ncbi:hypothetical protein L6V77_15860 [Myxococcota bacterium]|nr:hypothetical protein [Myxococcota bacterium]
MRRVALGVLAGWLVLGACDERLDDPEPAVGADAESTARLLLTDELFAPPEKLRRLFATEHAPEDFPLRMTAEGPNELAGARIDRLRMVDGRAVVEARVTLGGRAQVFTFWLERHEGAWRVAGWLPAPRPLPEAAAPVARTPPDPPPALLGAVFRAAHPVHTLPLVEVPRAGATSEPPAVVVRFKELVVVGDCREAAVDAALAHARGALEACHQGATGKDAPKSGRLTFQLTYTPKSPEPAVALKETTLLLPGLSDCATAALSAARLEGKDCLATVPVLFGPAPATP